MLNRTPELLQVHYSDHIRLMPEFQKTVMSKRNALIYHQAFLNRYAVKEYNRQEVEILDLGSMVTEFGQFTMKIQLKNTGNEFALAGKYQTIWEKGANNKLTLLTEAWNYNQPLAFEEQLRFEEVLQHHTALHAHLPINSPIRFELAALNQLMESAVTEHDVNVWSQFYTEDGLFGYSRHPIYKGKKEILEFLERHARELPIFEELNLRTDRVDDIGRYVIEYASHIANWRKGEHSGVATGKDLRIWCRENDCSRKLFRHMALYD